MFESITAQNKRNNATLARAREIQATLIADGISKDPRIFADKFIFNGCMIPENSKVKTADLPGWATENWDGTTTLENMEGGLPADFPVYLAIYVAEGRVDENFCYVAEIDAEMTNQGKTLRQAVNVDPSSN